MRKRISQYTDQQDSFRNSAIEHEQDHDVKDQYKDEVIYHDKIHRKPVFYGMIMAVVLGVGFSMFFGQSSTGKAEEVVGNRISNSTTAGDNLFKSETNAGILPKNFPLEMNDSSGSARMLIWDFNKEDLDQVQILVDGKPVKEQLILTKDPAAISIPVPSIITVTGLKDHGGGISYAVKFPNNRQTYFNVVSVGGSNTYTVTVK
jgi:hypothetical protein